MRDVLTSEQVLSLLSGIVGEVSEHDESVVKFTPKRFDGDFEVVLSIEDLNFAVELINQSSEEDDTGLYKTDYYEILCREENRFSIINRQIDRLDPLNDTDNGITYVLGKPSLAYAIKTLIKANASGLLNDFRTYFSRSELRRVAEESGNNTIVLCDYLYYVIIRCWSLKITSNTPMKLKSFHKLVTSYIFQISFNLSSVIIPIKTLDELFRRRISGRMRRSSINELDPPRRAYTNDLVYHYQMALSSDVSFLSYLSFYHIFEHYFESVFNDDLIETVKRELTSPSFSYKRKNDIAGLIKKVSKAVQLRGENQSFNEQAALKLTLDKYVVVDTLKADLESYKSGQTDYYKLNKVTFSEGDTIDFDDIDKEKIIAQIAKRVYKTRNSLVHSKDGDKSKYTPFHDDKQLLPELPLLQFMAEQVIINSSEDIRT